ncbi:hypothetical protein [Litorilituus lipolyticus]|uniref:Lipoprotein n=1 Tax=Litorilituus lipolyticus TaxID=2491017 RepID=A0A502L287_9GAMM|nr:hypothetical protein [Litorilituus lipolyticus]TPH18018.1 hypothetical protein EPA86_02565 [Litorilituus lipolyticus]
MTAHIFKVLLLSVSLLNIASCGSASKIPNTCREQAYGEHNNELKDSTSDVYARCQARHKKAQQAADKEAQKESVFESITELLEEVF